MYDNYIRIFGLFLFAAYGSSIAMDNRLAIECTDGNLIHVNRELIRGTNFELLLAEENQLPDNDGSEPNQLAQTQEPFHIFDNQHQFARHFTAPHMEQFLNLLAHPEHLNEIEDIHELESSLIIGDFLALQTDRLRSISLRIINICHELTTLHPHVKDIMMMNMRDYLIRQDDGTFHLDLHHEAGADITRCFREPIKLISLFDHQTRQRISSIDLRRNQLETLNFQELIQQTPHLKNLDLSHNNLRQFHATLPCRFSLDISHNRLTALTLENAQQDHLRINCTHNNLDGNTLWAVRNTLEQKSVRDYLVIGTRGVMSGLRAICRDHNVRHFAKTLSLMIGASHLYSKILYPKIISKICSPLIRKLPQRWLKPLTLTTFLGSAAYHGIEFALNLARHNAAPLAGDDLATFRAFCINGCMAYINLLGGALFSGIKSNDYSREEFSRILPHFVALPILYNPRLWNKFQPPLERHVIDPLIGLTDPATARASRMWDRGINALDSFTAERRNLQVMDI